MSDTTSTIVKPIRKFDKQVYAVNMKPPSLSEGETADTPTTKINFVTTNGNLQTLPCNKAVFRTVEGKPRPGRPHPGLDMRSNLDFLIGIKDNKAIAVDILPKIKKPVHNVSRADQDIVDNVELSIDANGQVYVNAVPDYVTTKGLVRLIQLIDAQGKISPGMLLGGKHEVMAVAGSRVEVEFAAEAPSKD